MENDYQIWNSPINKLGVYEPWKNEEKKAAKPEVITLGW